MNWDDSTSSRKVSTAENPRQALRTKGLDSGSTSETGGAYFIIQAAAPDDGLGGGIERRKATSKRTGSESCEGLRIAASLLLR